MPKDSSRAIMSELRDAESAGATVEAAKSIMTMARMGAYIL
jgi:hypothetical protein